MRHDGGFVLTPVSSIVQFRPNFDHIAGVTDKKANWQPIRVNHKEQAQIAADELLKPSIEESVAPVAKSGYLNELAPLCNESLENDFSTCSLQKDKGSPNLSADFLNKSDNHKSMIKAILQKQPVITIT